MKLLLENWRRYINEQTNEVAQTKKEFQDRITQSQRLRGFKPSPTGTPWPKEEEKSELWNYRIQPEQKIFVSSEPFSNFRNVQQKKPSHAMEKPKGLWYGCGDSWIIWTKRELPHMLEKAKYLYEVKLGEEIIQISDDDELTDFQSNFGFTTQYHETAIDWDNIQAQDYHGVEICPYQGQRRLHHNSSWYYGWDVASGCIWNSAGISNITLLAERGDNNETTI